MTHHLGHQTALVGHWTFNVDTLATSTAIAVIIAALFYVGALGARTDRAPTGLTLFAEHVYDWVDGQVAEGYQGGRRFMTALSLSLFAWVVSMNAMDLIPADLRTRWPASSACSTGTCCPPRTSTTLSRWRSWSH